MKKKFIVIITLLLLFINPFSFTFAKEKVIYSKAENLAKQYIENSLNDENWKNNNPHINGIGKYFYTDDEKNPSYIEFKISCDKTPDCGFILVNADGNDVAVPISSTSGNTPSEVTKQEGEQKNYYFGPLDIYSENIVTGDVQTIVIPDQIDLKKNDKETKETKQKFKNELKDRKVKSKDFKKSDDFKKKKEEIKEQILKMPKEEFSFKSLDMAFADLPEGPNGNYIFPGVSDKIVPSYTGNNSLPNCTSRTPCYSQFDTPYNNKMCASGCSPTAIAILFGYYDLNGFPNLVSGTAPTNGNGTVVQTLVNSIKTYIGTYCKLKSDGSKYEGATNSSDIKNAKQYAINKGYKNTTSFYITGNNSTLFTEIKTEINANRPVILNSYNPSTLGGHSMVVYGYKTTPSNSNIVLMNMGWGAFNVDGGTTYTYSSINQNIGAIYYFGSNNKYATSIVKFTIKN